LELIKNPLGDLDGKCIVNEEGESTRLSCSDYSGVCYWTISASAGGNTNSTRLETSFAVYLDLIVDSNADEKTNVTVEKTNVTVDYGNSEIELIETKMTSPFVLKVS